MGEANGRSYEPDISADGRFVAFTSRADNLVPSDDNGVEDVFVRDLASGVTSRVSQRGGGSPAGRSRAPSISPDGGWVSFESTAPDLVERDTNKLPDVFLAERATGDIQRVSLSTREVQQNRAVQPPFLQVSDVSEGGRYVAFDSDASNLVRGDRNRDTDVFVRDVRRGRTQRVSVTVVGREGDNDSYFPSISDDGRFVAFTSFASNLYPRDARGEDLFVADRRLRTSVLLSAREDGRRRGREQAKQLLRGVSVALDAGMVAFSSTARLAAGDRDTREDVHLRRVDAPQTRLHEGPSGSIRSRRPRIRLGANDRLARVFLCRLDGRAFLCPRDGRLPRLRRGRHTLSIRAGGPGLLFDRTTVVRRFRVRRTARSSP